MKLIVALLIVTVACTQAQPSVLPTISENPETENPEFTANGEKLWEGDMVLNEKQVEYFTSPLDTRKAIIGEQYRWTDGRVPFTISKSSEKDTDVIFKALQHWTDNSCVQFEEVEDGAEEPHLIFVKGKGCHSKVGMQEENGQEVSIGKNCAHMGTVAHEVGHALGFWHEQSRPDRDQFVKVLMHNINKTHQFNYNIHEVNTYGIPYDLGSVMHYGLHSFSINDGNTMVPIDIHKNFLIGQREKLSFSDLKLANIMYKCNARCTEKPSCSHHGYVDRNCHCKCPDGFSGNSCETSVEKGEEPCGGTFKRPTTIQTLNYPNNYPKQNCIWLFQAPAGKKVQVTFTDFDVIYREKTKSQCLFDYLEVRTENRYEGKKYCGEELDHYQITSEGNEMALLFRAKYDGNTGFKAQVTFV